MHATLYPYHPGSRGTAETSREAADKIASVAKTQRTKVLAALLAVHPEGRSSDQIATATGISTYSVRSRVSELMAAGQVERTGDRTKNDGGRNVMLWRAAQ